MSDTTTDGIRIQIHPHYLAERSDPDRAQFVFAYRVRITNQGDQPARLRSRHWIIRDAQGRREDVRGPGVVGETPRLDPGQSFEYTSFCPLPTPTGSMSGSFHMTRDDGAHFDAQIGVFSLVAAFLLN